MGYIYKITNNINKKMYIGKTIRQPEIRWNEHLTDTRHPDLPLQRAFKKYGKEQFTFEIIEEVDDSLLNDLEIYYIKHFNSFEHGYNATTGGEGGANHILSKEQQELILNLWQEKKTIKEISNITGHSFQSIRYYILKTGIDKETYLEQIKEHKKISQKNKKTKIRQKSFEIFNEEQRNEIFNLFNNYYACTYIAKKIGCSYKKMYNFLKKFYTEEEIKQRSQIKTSLSNKYYKYSLDNKLIKIYNNREELKQDYTESQIKVLQNCARGVKKNAYGYKWSYIPLKDNYEVYKETYSS